MKGRTHIWNRLWSSPLPTLGCEICPAGVSLARWLPGADRLEAAVWRPLPAGAVEASPLRDNIHQPDAVQQVLAANLESLGLMGNDESRTRILDAVLVVPDQAARLFVLDFEAFPDRPTEALAVLQWRLKKSVPFEIESASISYSARQLHPAWQVVAVVTPQFVIRQYEDVVRGLGLRPRWVTLSTLACLGLAEDSRGNGSGGGGSTDDPAPGVLLVKYSPPWLTLCILQQDCLRLFRTVGLAAEDTASSLAAQVLEALYPSFAYFQDHFQAPLAQAYLCGLGQESDITAAALEREMAIASQLLLSEQATLPAGLGFADAERYFASILGMIREQQSG